MKKSSLLIALVFLGFSFSLKAQVDFPFEVRLKPVSVTELNGLHSYAYGQHDGKWLLIGGRLDGLHARQPFNAFPAASNNTELIVIDVQQNEVWRKDLNVLSTSLQEQLQATNFCFHQVDDTLYIAGGYAFSASAADHITFPYLSSLIVSEVIDAVVADQDPSAFIHQVQDERMAVTGGHMAHMDNELMIVGGHRFDGRYNPMGHNTYVQTYTNAIRTFQVNHDGNSIGIINYDETTDQAHLHRRDYNLIPQQFGDGSFGFMISSGVFQVNADLPFLYPVEITSSGHQARTAFNQYLSNYHSATATVFDSASLNNFSLFFGGMARYQYTNGQLVADDRVPFVKTISVLARNQQDELEELVLPIEMPSLQGASAEFIPNPSLDYIENEIALVRSDQSDSILLGHIFGGIHSTQANPFTSNNTGVTSADDVLLEVWLKTNVPASAQAIHHEHRFEASVYPNPLASGPIEAELSVPYDGSAYLLITDASGRIVQNLTIRALKTGKNHFQLMDAEKLQSGTYHFTFIFDDVYYQDSSVIIQR
jgi:hypothetical protein